MTRVALFIFCVLFTAPFLNGCAPSAPKEEAITVTEKVETAPATPVADKASKTVEEYQKTIAADPESAEAARAHFEMGRVFFDQNRYDEAISELTRSLEISPDMAESHFLRGAAYAESGRSEEALSDLKKVLELKPDFVPAYFLMGNTYLAAGDYDAAIENLTKAIDMTPGEAKFYHRRATAYHDRGLANRSPDDFAAAIADYNMTVNSDPEYQPNLVYRWRADSYNAIEDYPAAIADYNKALEIAPDDPILYCDRGNAYLRSGEYLKAKEDYVTAINLDPESRAGKAAYDNLQILVQALEQQTNAPARLSQDEIDKLNSLEKEWGMNIDKAVPFIQERNYTAAQVYVQKSRDNITEMSDLLSARGYNPAGIDRIVAMDRLVTVYSHLNELSAYANNPAEAVRNWAEVNALFLDTHKQLNEAEAKFHEVPPLQGLCRQIREILNELEAEVRKLVAQQGISL